MKKFSIAFMLLLGLFSCTNDDTNSSDGTDYYGKWKLVKMTGSIKQPVYITDELQWQEFYVFNTNGTFAKTRIKDNNTVAVSGTFVIANILNETHLELTYSTSNDIVGSCYGNQKEDLFIKSNGLLVSTWQNCDGPGMEYKKTE
jgi:hypothetical protein